MKSAFLMRVHLSSHPKYHAKLGKKMAQKPCVATFLSSPSNPLFPNSYPRSKENCLSLFFLAPTSPKHPPSPLLLNSNLLLNNIPYQLPQAPPLQLRKIKQQGTPSPDPHPASPSLTECKSRNFGFLKPSCIRVYKNVVSSRHKSGCFSKCSMRMVLAIASEEMEARGL